MIFFLKINEVLNKILNLQIVMFIRKKQIVLLLFILFSASIITSCSTSKRRRPKRCSGCATFSQVQQADKLMDNTNDRI